MSNRSSHFARRLQTLPSALAGVSGSRRLLALAAVLSLALLTLAYGTRVEDANDRRIAQAT